MARRHKGDTMAVTEYQLTLSGSRNHAAPESAKVNGNDLLTLQLIARRLVLYVPDYQKGIIAENKTDKLVWSVDINRDQEEQYEECSTMDIRKSVMRGRNIVKDERGVTALEYGLIAALIAVVIIGGITSVGTGLNATFSNVSSAISKTAK